MAADWTLVAWLSSVVASGQGRLAALDDGDEWSYRRLWTRAGEIASWLSCRPGFSAGSRVALIGANEPEYLAAYFGIMRAGGVAVPLNALLRVDELRAQVELVGAVGTIVGDLPDELAAGLGEGGRTFRPAEIESSVSASLPSLEPRSPACVLLTSGSTGSPKGVLHTQGTLLHAALQIAGSFPVARDERSVAFLPFFASIPEQVLPTLVMGGALHTIRRFDVDRICAACRDATSFDAVPTIMARLLDHGDVDALSRLRWVMFASEPMPEALLQRWWETLPGTETHQLYGMTEMLTITGAPDRLLRARPDSVGVAFPTSAVEIIDADGAVAPPGVEGEVTCRSPARMERYLNDPDATAAALTAQGAMRTGDLGVIDEAGHLRLTGRLKDLIISGGLNIAPAEIEAVACRHPRVAAAAVVGIPDPEWGETPVVVAVPVNGDAVSAADVLEFCRAELAGFKRPAGAALMDALPLTGIGKSSKSEIRRRIIDGEVVLVRSR